MKEDNTMYKTCIKHIKSGNVSELKNTLKQFGDITAFKNELLLAAVENTKLDIVKILIEAGYKEEGSIPPNSILTEAVLSYPSLPIVKELLNAGANPDSYYYEASVLSHVCYNLTVINSTDIYQPIDDVNFEIAKVLLEAGASPNGSHIGAPSCPIEYPIIANDIRTVQLLIDHGAKLQIIAVQNAACYSAYTGNYQMLELLLNNGLKANPKKRKNKKYQSPLHYAIAGGHRNIVELLIKYKIDVNYIPNYNSLYSFLRHISSFKNHPLIVAIEHNEFELAELLLENGCNPIGGFNPEGSAFDNFDQTPSLHAVIFTDIDTNTSIKFVDLLLRYGADLNIIQHDATPAEWALKEGKGAIAEYLMKKR